MHVGHILQCNAQKFRFLSRKPHPRPTRCLNPKSCPHFALNLPPGLFRDTALDHESLDLVLESADLAHEVRGLVGGDAAADDSAADTAGTAESHLAGDVNLDCHVSE